MAGSDLRARFVEVADVLRAADPERPERVSTRKFNAVRSTLRNSSLPNAKDLAHWLGMSWTDVKTVALDEDRDKVRTYRSRHRVAPRPWNDPNGAAVAVRRVAEALDRGHLSATEYDAYRRGLSKKARDVLPTSSQIVKLFGSWDESVMQAGLHPRPESSSRALSVVDAIGLFVRTQGRLPGRAELEAFAMDPRWRFPLQRTGDRRWQDWLHEFEAWWVGDLKRWMPSSSAGRPLIALTEAEIATLPNRLRAPKGWWNRARVIDCVVAYLDEHPGVPSLRQPAYRAWAKERAALGTWTAAPSTLTKHGSLEELEREARRKMNSTHRPQTN